VSDILITAGPFQFTARLETAEAPRTCEAILRQLPLTAKLTVERNKSFTNALENPFDFRNVMPQFRVEPLSIADVDDGAKQAMTGWDFFY
jgi:hypothetical protein